MFIKDVVAEASGSATTSSYCSYRCHVCGTSCSHTPPRIGLIKRTLAPEPGGAVPSGSACRSSIACCGVWMGPSLVTQGGGGTAIRRRAPFGLESRRSESGAPGVARRDTGRVVVHEAGSVSKPMLGEQSSHRPGQIHIGARVTDLTLSGWMLFGVAATLRPAGSARR